MALVVRWVGGGRSNPPLVSWPVARCWLYADVCTSDELKSTPAALVVVNTPTASQLTVLRWNARRSSECGTWNRTWNRRVLLNAADFCRDGCDERIRYSCCKHIRRQVSAVVHKPRDAPCHREHVVNNGGRSGVAIQGVQWIGPPASKGPPAARKNTRPTIFLKDVWTLRL